MSAIIERFAKPSIGREFKNDICANLMYSASTALAVGGAVPYRNTANDTLHMVFGSLFFAGLAILSLIETVARAILCIPFVPLSYCVQCVHEGFSDLLFGASAYGTLVTAENFVCCIVATVKSFTTDKMKYDQLVPCITEWNKTHKIIN